MGTDYDPAARDPAVRAWKCADALNKAIRPEVDPGEAVKKLRDVLKVVEWRGLDKNGYGCCPACNGSVVQMQHKSGCKLAAVLAMFKQEPAR